MIVSRMFLGFSLLIFFLSAPVYAQADADAFFTADIGSPVIGQPIDLVFTVNVPDGTVVKFADFPADWPPLMIQSVAEMSTTSSNGITTYTQHLIVLLWRPGEFQTPETLVEYQLPNSVETRQAAAQPAYFNVKSILDENDFNLRPLKPQLAMFYFLPLMGASVLFGLVMIGVFVWSKRKQINLSRISATNGSLHPAAQVALSEIRRISSANNFSRNAYVVVSDALRYYLQGRFGVNAIDMTSQELMIDLSKAQDLSERRQHELANLLEQADLVKFASVQPPSKSTDKLLNVAYGWVMAVEQDTLEAAE